MSNRQPNYVRAGSQATVPTSYFNVPNGTVSQILTSDANVSNNALALSRHIAANQNAISHEIMAAYDYRSRTTSACVNRWCNEAIMGNQIYQGTNGQLYNLPNTNSQYHLNRFGQAVPGKLQPSCQCKYDSLPGAVQSVLQPVKRYTRIRSVRQKTLLLTHNRAKPPRRATVPPDAQDGPQTRFSTLIFWYAAASGGSRGVLPS